MKTLRIFSGVHSPNHGACIFNETLYRTLASSLPMYDVGALDYIPRNWLIYERLRALKPHLRIPLFNLMRQVQAIRFHKQHIKLDKPTTIYPFGYNSLVKFLADRCYDALVVGRDLWNIRDEWYMPGFPNIYWLSEKIPSIKIAYAVSGYRSKIPLIKRQKPVLQRILSSYALIGVRDDFTWEMVHGSLGDMQVPVVRSPDPVFLYENKPTNVRNLLAAYGIDLLRPILGLLIYGHPAFSKDVSNYYRRKGFQVVAFSMYNPYADVNLGHIITPYEWADIFNLLSFCVTDRLHGTSFCLKANIPFIAIEPFIPKKMKHSKIYSLLSDFSLIECYMDILKSDFKTADFTRRAEDISLAWGMDFSPKVNLKLDEMKQRSLDFVDRIKDILTV